nr:uncharacterized protein LOC125989974 isoform X2 [Syngnathus scovelli]XP_049617920.1 uncharacterized protein LOC125993430 isoform X2 [Syngnathus scovelli]
MTEWTVVSRGRRGPRQPPNFLDREDRGSWDREVRAPPRSFWSGSLYSKPNPNPNPDPDPNPNLKKDTQQGEVKKIKETKKKRKRSKKLTHHSGEQRDAQHIEDWGAPQTTYLDQQMEDLPSPTQEEDSTASEEPTTETLMKRIEGIRRKYQEPTGPNSSETPIRRRETPRPKLLETIFFQSRDTQTEPQSMYTTHEHEGNKRANWFLFPQRRWLIVGDSNLAKLQKIEDREVQVDCYPGAKIRHGIHLLRNRTATSPNVLGVILSLGLNNRGRVIPIFISKEIARLLGAAKATFPYAKIFIPKINYSQSLPLEIQANLRELNEIIEETGHSIQRLPSRLFTTGPDNIHWTTDTAEEIDR